LPAQHAHPILTDSILEHVLAKLDSLIILVFAQNALLDLFGAQLQANVFTFVVKMQHILKLLELVCATLDLDCILDHAKHVLITILSQMDTVLLVQLTLSTMLLQKNATVQLDSLLINGESARKSVEQTKSTQVALKDAHVFKDLEE